MTTAALGRCRHPYPGEQDQHKNAGTIIDLHIRAPNHSTGSG